MQEETHTQLQPTFFFSFAFIQLHYEKKMKNKPVIKLPQDRKWKAGRKGSVRPTRVACVFFIENVMCRKKLKKRPAPPDRE